MRSTFFLQGHGGRWNREIDVEIDEVAYIKAIRTNINAGGAICLGAILLGAVFGAAAGSVPASFVEKFPKETTETVEKAIQEICCVLN